MSKFLIETERIQKIDGDLYQTEIKRQLKKEVNIDFSVAKFSVKLAEKDNAYENFTAYLLVPNNFEIFRELTDLFPLSEYDFEISQPIFKKWKQQHVSIEIYIREKQTEKCLYIPNSPVLSDKDYSYLRKILMEEFPQYEWETEREYLTREILQFLSEESDDILSTDAEICLDKLISKQYPEIKAKGYADFDDDIALGVKRKIVETALKRMLEES